MTTEIIYTKISYKVYNNENINTTNVTPVNNNNNNVISFKEKCAKINKEIHKMHTEQKQMESMLFKLELMNIPMSHEPHPCGNGIHAALYIRGKVGNVNKVKVDKNKAHHYR